VILFDLINEGSKRDSKSAAARGEKNGAHSQILSCDIAEKLQAKNKKASKPCFLILQDNKNEINYVIVITRFIVESKNRFDSYLNSG
jgi:hypothetical protein